MLAKRTPALIFVCAVTLSYYGLIRWKHKYDRPWAYAADHAAPLLVGKWQGRFNDPDGVSKQMDLEITEPEVDDDILNQSKSRGRRGNRSLNFTGSAVITSSLGTEKNRLEGKLGNSDGHEITRINFIPVNEKKQIRESFNVADTEPGGLWQGDSIQLKLVFNYITKTGSAFWSSGDARFTKHTPVTLYRKNP
ncbi:hypothetical protein FEM33_16510 [Dyadobacter flavalbus]|uniref:Uncharacterized protein n=1 Tax=Dyadobacter flavalbus TaxID=2579942 RepID=A0A5M8QQD0_9BACT|nr:hypothetical protein [Dyadobacter flavalbus]KAA6438299.1 hypothetical protein FEM33_16510 [Dyadobacter flavalbus]